MHSEVATDAHLRDRALGRTSADIIPNSPPPTSPSSDETLEGFRTEFMNVDPVLAEILQSTLARGRQGAGVTNDDDGFNSKGTQRKNNDEAEAEERARKVIKLHGGFGELVNLNLECVADA